MNYCLMKSTFTESVYTISIFVFYSQNSRLKSAELAEKTSHSARGRSFTINCLSCLAVAIGRSTTIPTPSECPDRSIIRAHHPHPPEPIILCPPGIRPTLSIHAPTQSPQPTRQSSITLPQQQSQTRRHDIRVNLPIQ